MGHLSVFVNIMFLTISKNNSKKKLAVSQFFSEKSKGSLKEDLPKAEDELSFKDEVISSSPK